MVDRVQALKQEWNNLGGDATDESMYPEPIEPQEDALESAGLFVQDQANRDESVLISRDGPDLTFQDISNPVPLSLSDLASSSSGMTEAGHAALDTLLHNLDEDHEVFPTFSSHGVITEISVKTPAGVLIRDASFDHNAQGLITRETMRQYDSAGQVVASLEWAYVYTSGQISSVTVTRTP